VTIAIIAGLVAVAAALAFVAYRQRRPAIDHHGVERILVPFTGGALDPAVLGAGIRIARAEDATLVPAYLIVVPLEQPQDAPMEQQVTRAMPLLEAVEHAALRSGVPVDARIESGRTPVHECAERDADFPAGRVVGRYLLGKPAGAPPGNSCASQDRVLPCETPTRRLIQWQTGTTGTPPTSGST
jgi:hypothetical protein